uniref:AsmA domain-containing protein n=1 Tax=mine drainage metagenome TaxID=410659 RepID=E6QK75_9ZZZZ
MTNGHMENGASEQAYEADMPYNARRRLLWLALGLVVLLGLALVLPSVVSIGRYRRTVTGVMARSLGRPVHLSGVEWRLLPSPAFVLHDLTVSEDPAFGAEPILFARTVVASVDIFSLWGGHPVFSRISVDEASLNMVRNDQGRWNVESLITGPAQETLTAAARRPARKPAQLPYLEATNTRVNLKHGYEKSPFSIVNADLSFWQDGPGRWRVRLRGQPVRTDINLSREADAGTGEVRMEGSLDAAPEIRQMPLHLQLAWREAQLGQLTRLILGTDAGWRGDLTADLEVTGTAETAQTRARLLATGVHRAEFEPDSPLDFDSNCSFVYQHSANALHQVACDTQIANGHLLVKAEFPGAGSEPQVEFQSEKIPLQAGLDLLRTVRSDFAPGVAARGEINGMLKYAGQSAHPAGTERAQVDNAVRSHRSAAVTAAEKLRGVSSPALSGSLSIDGGDLRGGGFENPLPLPKVVFTPTPTQHTELTAKFSLSGKSATKSVDAEQQPPLSVRLALNLAGYHAAITGSSSIHRMRTLSKAFGMGLEGEADGFTAGSADLDINAAGPWLTPMTPDSMGAAAAIWSGTLQLHHARWQAPYLARPVELPQGVVALNGASETLNAEFVYGPVHGTLGYAAQPDCTAPDCAPTVQIHFAQLDAAALQAALLGPSKPRDLLQSITDRMHSDTAPAWPSAHVKVDVGALNVGSITLKNVKVSLHRGANTAASEVLIDAFDAASLGGSLHGSGTVRISDAKPVYSIQARWHGLNPALVSALLGAKWSGAGINASTTLTTTGTSAAELAASGKGTLDFDWQRGSLGAASPAPRLDRWSGTAEIASGKATMGKNTLISARRQASLTGSISLGGPVRLALAVRPSAR